MTKRGEIQTMCEGGGNGVVRLSRLDEGREEAQCTR